MLEYTLAPIDSWPQLLTDDRTWDRFSVGWTDTLWLLEREIDQLGGENVVIKMAVRPQDIRRNGRLRANARTEEHPGVIVCFDSRFGHLTYPCDTFNRWQANVRAIALALEALRKVDRYGVSKRGEQYSGFGQLPPAGGSSAEMDLQTAAEIIVDAAQVEIAPQHITTNLSTYRSVRREALRYTHPDSFNGQEERFKIVNRATAVLDKHHGGGG